MGYSTQPSQMTLCKYFFKNEEIQSRALPFISIMLQLYNFFFKQTVASQIGVIQKGFVI